MNYKNIVVLYEFVVLFFCILKRKIVSWLIYSMEYGFYVKLKN